MTREGKLRRNFLQRLPHQTRASGHTEQGGNLSVSDDFSRRDLRHYLVNAATEIIRKPGFIYFVISHHPNFFIDRKKPAGFEKNTAAFFKKAAGFEIKGGGLFLKHGGLFLKHGGLFLKHGKVCEQALPPFSPVAILNIIR